MNSKKYICLLSSFATLNSTYHLNKNLFNTINKEFGKLYFINTDNLKFFSKPKKYNFSEELKNKPKNIVFFNPQNSKEFKNFIKDKVLIAINNFGKSFVDFKVHMLVKNKNIIQIQIKNIGNFQMTHHVYIKHIFLTLKYLILNRLFRKVTTILSILGIINKFDITFISNKIITDSFNKNIFKKFLYKNKLLFTKQFCLVNSKFYDALEELKKNLSNKYIVHLDYYLNYKDEIMLRGEMDPASVKKHHECVSKFLLTTQKRLDKEVVICIHPLYPIEYFRNFYKDFRIIKYKTAEFIRDANLVTFFNSSAIVNAILLRKKIIQLSSKYMDKNEQLQSNVYKIKLGLQKIELDKFNEENFDSIYKKSYPNQDLLNNYISNFHELNDGENGTSKIISTIKKRYF